MSTAISVENVTKSYRLGMIGGATLKEDFARWWAKARGKADPLQKIGEEHHARRIGEQFWALQDVSFDVQQGEVLAIIGSNGAGKSTLLKILSQVTAPTSGQIKVKGRIASLLEVGTGFHPELSGRENIFLNGAILGMTKMEIRAKLDEIIDFSGIEEFIDTPVKRYSSGMYVRLAFAVAAHLEPEILIIDEVLAVGDAAFQEKCLGKMGEVSKKRGRTVLFVSHNKAAVKALCSRAVLLREGVVDTVGDTDTALARYSLQYLGTSASRDWSTATNAPGNDKVRLRSIRFVDEEGNAISTALVDRTFFVEVEFTVTASNPRLNVSLSLYSQEGVYVLASPSLTDSEWCIQPHPVGCYRSRCKVPGSFLNSGTYHVSVLLVENGVAVIAEVEKAVCIEILDSDQGRGGYFGDWNGVVRPSLEWKTSKL